MNFKKTIPTASLPQNNHRFINVKEVSKIVGFNVDWIYKKITKGEFPKPIKIGRSSRWSYLEVMDWMSKMINLNNDKIS